jgi:hypothetical protein
MGSRQLERPIDNVDDLVAFVAHIQDFCIIQAPMIVRLPT